jgi:hypothetical protein
MGLTFSAYLCVPLRLAVLEPAEYVNRRGAEERRDTQRENFTRAGQGTALQKDDQLLGRSRAFSFAISRSIFSVPAVRTSSFTTS